MPTKKISQWSIRQASVADIPALLKLEQACFETDRLTRRNFHWMLTKAHATLLLAEKDRLVDGYVLILYHRGTSLARVYSMAVAAHTRGSGLGTTFLELAEADAKKHNCVYMRLEVRPDNGSAIRLYEKQGYRLFDIKDDFYEDHAAARRYEKRIHRGAPTSKKAVPFYEQTTDFTCGPAALMMAMSHLRPKLKLSSLVELQIWREATTIFMTSGHGGCGPHGLALAAKRRGFKVDVYLNQTEQLFVEGVRNEQKKRIIELVQQDFEEQIAATDIRLHNISLSLDELAGEIRQGAAAIVLISSYRLTRSKAPHWVVITGIDQDWVYVHDPEVDYDEGKTPLDCSFVPIARKDFANMMNFGSRRLRAMIVLGN